jgi:protein MPE1
MGNKDYDNRPKLKKTTGIPKMFLKTVENKDASGGLMVSQTGEIVVAQPNEYVPF